MKDIASKVEWIIIARLQFFTIHEYFTRWSTGMENIWKSFPSGVYPILIRSMSVRDFPLLWTTHKIVALREKQIIFIRSIINHNVSSENRLTVNGIVHVIWLSIGYRGNFRYGSKRLSWPLREQVWVIIPVEETDIITIYNIFLLAFPQQKKVTCFLIIPLTFE